MRVVFFGTPQIAVPALQALTSVADVAAVVCQPDRPAGRGLKLTPPPTKVAATELGIPIHQPHKVRSGLGAWLALQKADAALVIAYGRILPTDVLEAPRRGCYNLHASLLPKYRGAAPIQWAIVRGECTTGISLMEMTAGLDEGPVFTQRTLDIGPAETAGELAVRLGALAAQVTVEDFPKAVRGELTAVEQNRQLATYAPQIERADARIPWEQPASVLFNHVRGFAPEPGAYTMLRGRSLRVLQTRVATEMTPIGPVGMLVVGEHRRAYVVTGQGMLELLVAQPEGRKATPAADLINGRVLIHGESLT